MKRVIFFLFFFFFFLRIGMCNNLSLLWNRWSTSGAAYCTLNALAVPYCWRYNAFRARPTSAKSGQLTVIQSDMVVAPVDQCECRTGEFRTPVSVDQNIAGFDLPP
jgi:hypothetical protein